MMPSFKAGSWCLVLLVACCAIMTAPAQQRLQLNNTVDQYFVIRTPLTPIVGSTFEYSLTAYPGILQTSAAPLTANDLVMTDANGQLMTTTLTAGTGISITPGAGTLTIASTAALPTTTTDNATLRWNQATSEWQVNTNVLASASGGLFASTGAFGATSGQLVLGTGTTTTISATVPSVSSTYTIPDVGTTASFVMTEGTQTVNGAKTHLGGIGVNTSGTGTTTIGHTTGGTGAIAIRSGGVAAGDVTITVDSVNNVDLLMQSIKQDEAASQVLVLDGSQQVRRRSAASLGGAGSFIVSQVATDQINNNQAAYTNATGMAFAMEANKIYTFQAYVICQRQTANAGDVQFQFTTPVGAVGTYQWWEEDSGDGRPRATLGTASTAVMTNNNQDNLMIVRGFVRNGATAGNLQMQFRRTGTNNSVRIMTNSFVLAQKAN